MAGLFVYELYHNVTDRQTDRRKDTQGHSLTELTTNTGLISSAEGSFLPALSQHNMESAVNNKQLNTAATTEPSSFITSYSILTSGFRTLLLILLMTEINANKYSSKDDDDA